uniref:CPXV160 protein n=1 Tax=Heterorhabditis bacteriophora TaxID=37862 RepID=A0A1I7X112_HETBA
MELLDFISIAMHFFVDSTAMSLNFLLFYVILKYSPKSVHAYKFIKYITIRDRIF